MAEVYEKCGVCGEMTKHVWDDAPLCRDGRCREIVLGRDNALRNTHKYLTEKREVWAPPPLPVIDTSLDEGDAP